MKYKQAEPAGIMMEEPRGWFFPNEMVYLFETGQITSDELVLLGKIHVLHKVKKRGCYASNETLADWWGFGPMHVSRTISKFKKNGWVTVEIKDQYERTVRTCLHKITEEAEEYLALRQEATEGRNMRGFFKKMREGGYTSRYRGGIPAGIGGVIPAGIESKRYGSKQKNTAPSGAGGFFPNGRSSTQPKDKLAKLCEEYFNFATRKRLRHPDDGKPNLAKWRVEAQKVIDLLKDGFTQFEEVCEWYMENHRSPFHLARL